MRIKFILTGVLVQIVAQKGIVAQYFQVTPLGERLLRFGLVFLARAGAGLGVGL